MRCFTCAWYSVTSVISHSFRVCGPWPARLLCPWDSPGKDSGVGCHALLQGIVPPRDWTHVSCISCIPGGFFTTEPPGKSEAFRIASCLFSWLCSPPFHLPQLLLFSRPYTNYTLSSQSLSLYHWDYSRMIFSSPLMDIAFSITLVS